MLTTAPPDCSVHNVPSGDAARYDTDVSLPNPVPVSGNGIVWSTLPLASSIFTNLEWYGPQPHAESVPPATQSRPSDVTAGSSGYAPMKSEAKSGFCQITVPI